MKSILFTGAALAALAVSASGASAEAPRVRGALGFEPA